MRRLFFQLGVLLAATAVIGFLSACSSDDPGLLPGDDAQQILANLDRVEELAGNGECDAATESIETISRQVENLPNSVDGRLKQNLRRGVGRLSAVTAESCGADSDTDEETVTVPETTETDPEDELQDTTGDTTQEGDTTQGGGGGPRNDEGRSGDRGRGERGGNRGGGGSQRGEGNRTPPRGGDTVTPPEPTQPSDNGGQDDSGGISPAEPVEPSGEEQP